MKNKNKGFIQIVIIVVGALVLLKYVYDIDVVGFFTSDKFRGWLDKIYDFGRNIWVKYGGFIAKIWNYCLDFIKKIFN